jgi:2-haloacid dehalogenase
MTDLLAFLKTLASPGRTSGSGGSRTRHSPGA